jgi:hypothetical protein
LYTGMMTLMAMLRTESSAGRRASAGGSIVADITDGT